jgi:hypothetical protein
MRSRCRWIRGASRVIAFSGTTGGELKRVEARIVANGREVVVYLI